MQWKLIADEHPPIEKILLVWRHERKRYVPLYFIERTQFEEDRTSPFEWLSQHNCLYPVNPLDAWMSFDPYERMERYE